MEEKAKSKVLIYIIVILVLSILALVILGIIGYKSLEKKIGSANNNEIKTVEKEEITLENINTGSIIETNKEENESKEENIIEIGNNQQENTVTKNIKINEKEYVVKLQAIYEKIEGEEYDDEQYADDNNYYNSKYNVYINGKIISGIEVKKSCKGTVQEKDITKIADINGKEYLLIYTYVYNPANISYINLYIIDPSESNKVLGVVSHIGNVSYFIDENNRLKFEVNSNNIIDYIEKEHDTNTYILEKHKYTIENGNLKDIVENTYDKYSSAGVAR